MICDYRNRGKVKIGFMVLGIGCIVFIGFYNQPYYPVTWFDEGLALQGAINLVRFGEYAMRSAEGFRILDQPLIANGPGLIIPITLVFQIWGVELMNARTLMVVYFVMTALVFYNIASRFNGNISALISIFLLFAIPSEGFIFYGRQALGNVPALLYFLLGVLIFLKHGNTKKILYALGVGLFFGFALITKGQYWIFVPVLALVAIADYFFYKQIGLKFSVTMLLTTLACISTWFLMQLLYLGLENFLNHIAALSSSAKVTIVALRSIRIPGNLLYLVRSGFLLFILPGLVIALRDSRQPTLLGLSRFMLVTFVVFWIGWFVFASVGWHRYAFEAYAVGMILCGEFFSRIFHRISRDQNNFHASKRQKYLNNVSYLVLATLLCWAGLGFFQQLALICKGVDASAQLFAKYIKDNISTEAVIESWEWELDLLTLDHIYHHPTNDWVDRKTAETQFGEISDQQYDPLAYDPDFLIVGPFSAWTGIYSKSLSSGCCTHVVTIGDYTLYQVISLDQ